MNAYRLIGTPHSTAFAHLRRYLQWKNIPHTLTFADRSVLRSEVKARLGRIALPLLVTPDNHTLSNETAIVDQLERRRGGIVPLTTPSAQIVGVLLEMFAAKSFGPLVQANLAAESPADFTARIAEMAGSDDVEDAGSTLANRIFRQTCRRLARSGFDPEQKANVQAHLKTVLDLLEARLSKGPFLLGSSVTRADIAMQGPASVLWRHSRHIAGKANSWPGVQKWLRRIADILPGEQVATGGRPHMPELIKPLAAFAVKEVVPLAFESAAALADWADSHPGKLNLPASLGFTKLKDGIKREMTPDHQWHLQRLMAAADLESLPQSEREKLSAIGIGDIQEWQLPREIRYENHRFRIDLVATRDTVSPRSGILADMFDVMDQARESRGLDLALAG